MAGDITFTIFARDSASRALNKIAASSLTTKRAFASMDKSAAKLADQLEELNRKKVDPSVGAEARRRIDAMQDEAAGLIRELEQLDRQKADPSVGLAAKARIESLNRSTSELNRELNKLDRQHVSPSVRVAGATDTVAQLRLMDVSAQGAAIAFGAVLVPAVTSLASSLAFASTSLVAIGPAMIGAATAVGTVKLAFSGVGDAMKAYEKVQKSTIKGSKAHTAAMKEYQQQLSNLSPAARAFVAELVKGKDLLDKLKKTARGAFLPGFTSFLKNAKTLFPEVNRAIAGMGKVLGDAAAQAGKVVASGLFKSSLRTITNNNQIAFESLGRAINALIIPITRIFAGASPLVVRFTAYIEKLANKFAALVGSFSDAQIANFFKRAGDEMAKWWQIAVNIGGILFNILKASLPSGSDLVTRLKNFTGALREASGQDATREKIKSFFAFFAHLDYGRIAKSAASVGTMLALAKGFAALKGKTFNPFFWLTILAGSSPDASAKAMAALSKASMPLLNFAANNPGAVQMMAGLMTAISLIKSTKIGAGFGKALRDWLFGGKTGVMNVTAAVVNLAGGGTATSLPDQKGGAPKGGGGLFGKLKGLGAKAFGWGAAISGMAFLGVEAYKAFERGFKDLLKGFGRNVSAPMVGSFKSSLGMHSPSTVFINLGRDAMSSFNAGMQQTLNKGWIQSIGPWMARVLRFSLYGVGQSVMSGYVRGLRDTFEKGGTKGWIGSIRNWMVGQLRIGLYGTGQSTMQGYYRGLRDTFERGGAKAWITSIRPWMIKMLRISLYPSGQSTMSGYYRGLRDTFERGGAKAWLTSIRPWMQKMLRISLYPAGVSTMAGYYRALRDTFERGGAKSWLTSIRPWMQNMLRISLYQSGRSTMSGFDRGLRDYWEKTTKPFISSIPGWIVKNKGPLSQDARLLYPAGRAIMQGFHKGLQSGFASGQSFLRTVAGKVLQFMPAPIPTFGGGGGSFAVGGGVQRWASVALQALRMAGQSASWLPLLLRRMQQESGGNPRAINLWDINARRGDPSRGLMQTIGSTFNAYAGALRGRGIYDPLANIYASIRYTLARYGTLAAWARPGGYDKGGLLMPGATLAINRTGRPERVLNPKETAAYAQYPLGGARVEKGAVQVNVAVTSRYVTAEEVRQITGEAVDQALDKLARRLTAGGRR